MAKLSRTFRIAEEVNIQLITLSESFGESGGEIVERAVKLLYANRETELRKDNEARIGKLKAA